MFQSLEDSLGFFTTRAVRNMVRFLALNLKPFDVTPEQWTVLKRLCEADGVSQKELGQKAVKDKATLTRLLEILERKHLIQKHVNPEDKRSFLIAITPEGRALHAKIEPFIEEVFRNELLHGIPEDKLQIYVEVLEQIYMNTLVNEDDREVDD